MRIPVRHRLPFIVAAFALSVLSCGREVTGPENGIYRNRVAMLAFAPEFSGPMAVIEGAGDAVPFEKVRVVLRGLDGNIVKDTMVAFPSDADEISLALSIAIPQNSPAEGLPLTVTMAYVNAAGDTVFRGGPNPVVARPVGSPGAGTPVTIPVTYDGAGKDATRVAISPKTGTAVAGQSLAFSATAFDAADAAIPNTPFVFSTPDPTRATVNPVTGVATWLPVRGVARVIAELPNGARADTASFTVSLPASKLVLGSGGAQTGAVNAPLTDTIVVRTLASDDVPVEGVVVTFAVATGAGTLSVLTDTSDANGDVKTAWTLGAALGTQTITATSAGLTGSPLTISATAVAATPVRLEITQEPTGTTAGALFAPQLTVIARDAFGNAVPTFIDGVTVGVVGAEPPTLLGTTTRAAVAGTATFDDIGLTKAGAFQLVVSSGSLAPDTSATLVIEAAAAAQLAMLTQPPTSVAAGATFGAAVEVQDAFGNRVESWTSPVTAGFDVAPVGATFVSGGSADVISGLADFTDLQLDRAGLYRLRFTSEALTAALSDDFTVGAAGAEAMNALAGDLQTAAAGTALPTALAVVITDNFGNPIQGVTVNWSVVSGGGSFNVPSSVTNAAGEATATWTLGGVVGEQLASASAGFLPTVEFSATATAGAPTQLVLLEQPDSALAGETFAPSIVIEVRDAFGNRATSWSDSVRIVVDSGPVGGVVLHPVLGGRAEFLVNGGGENFGVLGGYEIEQIGIYRLSVVTDGGLSVALAPLRVVVGPAAQFGILSGNNQTVAVQSAFPDSLRVYVRDAFGNPKVGHPTTWSENGVVTLGVVGTVLTDSNGVASNTAIAGAAIGSQSAGPQVTTVGVGSNLIFEHTVTAAAATEVAFITQPDTVVAGLPFPPTLWLEFRDEFGNRDASLTDSVTMSIESGPEGGALLPPSVLTQIITNGGGSLYGQFAGLEIHVAGTYVLRATTKGGLTGVSQPIVVVPNASSLSFTLVSGGYDTSAVNQPFAAPLRVRVQDAFGNPMAGVQVAWFDQGGGATVAADTLVTDANGYAENTATHGPTPVALSAISAKLVGLEGTRDFFYTTLAAAPSTMTLLSGDGQSGTVATTLADPLVVEVRDEFGNLIEGAEVTWAVTSGDANVTIGVVQTDASGQSLTEIVLGTAPGTITVTATVEGLTPVTFTLTSTAAAAVYPDVVVAPQGGSVGSALAPFSYAVFDQYGNIATGYSGTAVVTLNKATVGEQDPVILAGDTVAVVNGVATWDSLVIATAGQYRIVADFGPTLGSYVSATLSFSAADPSNLLNAGGDGQSVAVTQSATNPLRARVTDAYGNGVSGVSVNFNVIDGLATLGAASVPTDAQGYAEVTVQMDTVAGPVLVGAFAEGLTPDSLLYALTALPGLPSALLIVDGDAQTIPAGGTTDTLRVRLKDAYGNAIIGETVTWDTPSDLTFSSTSSVTDSTGLATTTVIAGGTLGLLDVYARFALPELSAYFTVTVEPGAAATLAIVSAPDGGVAGSTLSSVVVELRDAFGNIAKLTDATVDVAVDAALTPGALGGTLSVLADSGIAVFSNLVLTQAGPYALVVSASGIAPDTTAQFTVLAGEPDTVFVSGGAGQVGIVGSALANPLEITVLDAYGNPVVGFETYWNIVETGGIFSTLDAMISTTDSAGVARMSLTFGPNPESFTVNASALDAGSVNFAMSSTNAAAAHLLVSAEPDGAIAGGIVGPIVVIARDSLLNTALDFIGDVTASIDSGPDGAVLGGSTTVAAVAGSAAFTDLTLDKAGAYRLRFQSAGLADTVTSTFSVTAAAVAQIAIVEGDAQTDTVGATLATPLRVRVTDAFGNPVSGVNLDWMADDNVSFGEFPIGTDINGEMAVAATLGAVAGAIEVRVAIAALPDSSVTFTLTALAGSAVELVITSAPDTVASGDTVSVVVEARDAFGNVATSFAGNVTIERSDTVADPLGTLTVSAVDGVASFTEIYFGLTGSYTLLAQADFDTASFHVGVIAGTGVSLSIESGDNQTFFTGLQLEAPITLRVTDAFGNGVEGDTVIVTRGVGTGVLGDLQDSLATIATGSDGRAYIYWTLGVELGTQTLNARTATLGPVTITATAEQSVANAIWTGELSSSVTDGGNWRHGLVPTSADSVLIPAGSPISPSLGESVTYAKLTLEDGALLNLAASDLTVLGSVTAPGGGIVASNGGRVILQGSGTISGSFPAVNVQGDYSTAGDVTTAGALLLAESGNLTLSSGDSLHVDGNLTTDAGGTITQAVASALFVNGDMSMGGGTSTFAGGARLHLFGNLTTTGDGAPTAFLADSAHELRLVSGANHSIDFNTPDLTPGGACTASCLGMVFADGEGTSLLFTSDAMSIGGFFVGTESEITALYGNGSRVVAAVPSTLLAASGNKFGSFGFTESFDVNYFDTDSLVAYGSGYLPANLAYPTIIAGQYLINDVHNAALIVDGVLGVEGNAAVVNGEFRTRGSGWLAMTEASDSLVVTGSAYFEGFAESGQLTAGVLDVQGEMFFVGAGGSLVADSGHVLRLANGSFTTLQVSDSSGTRLGSLRVEANTTVSLLAEGATFAGDVLIDGAESVVQPDGITWATIGGQLRDAEGSRFRANAVLTGTNAIATPRFDAARLVLRGSNTLSDSLVAKGLRIEGGGSLVLSGHTVTFTDTVETVDSARFVMAEPGDTLTALSALWINGGTQVMTDGVLQLNNSFSVGGGGLFQPGPAHTTEFIGSGVHSVGFNYRGFGPTESRLGRVVMKKFGGGEVQSATPVFIDGQLISQMAGQVWRGFGVANRLTIRGADITTLTLQNQPVHIVDGADVTNLANLVFTGYTDVGNTQLSIIRGGGTVSLESPVFDSTLAGAFFLAADDSVADGDALRVEVSNPLPALHSGRIGTSGEAQILGWGDFAALVWTGAVDSDWLNDGNWAQGRAPTSSDSVVVVGSFDSYPTVTGSSAVRALYFDAASPITVDGSLTISGSVAGNGEGVSISCGSFGSLSFASADSIVAAGRFACPVHVSAGRLTFAGSFQVDSLIIDGTGEVHVRDADYVNVTYDLRTADNGTLRMEGTSEAQVSVSRNATFASTPTPGSLTGGRLVIYGDFTQQSSPSAFAADSAHETSFDGFDSQVIRFDNPGPTDGSHFGRLRLQQAGGEVAVRLQSDVYADGELILLSGSTESVAGDGGHRLLQVRGVENNSDSGVEFADVRLAIVDGGTLDTDLYGFRFVNFSVAGTPQLRIARAGALVTLNFFQFDSEATSPLFLQVEDTDGLGQTMVAVTLTGTSPTFHGGAVETLGGASIVGWDAEELFVWSPVDLSTTWNDASNWSLSSVPDASSKVIIPLGATVTPVLVESTEIGSLTVLSSTVGVDLGSNVLIVRDSLVVPTGNELVQCSEGGFIHFTPTDTAWVQANTTCGIQVTSGTLTTRGALETAQSLNIRGSGTFIPRHNVVASVGGTGDNGPLGELRTEESGRFLMLEPDVTVDLAGGAIFKGGVSQLDAGTLIVADALVADSNLVTLTGSPAHVTELGLYSNQAVSFEYPAQNSVGSLRLASGVSRSVFTPITITGDLIVPSTSTISFDSAATIGGNLDIAGQSYCGAGTALTLSHSDAAKTFRAVVPTCDVALTSGNFAMADGPSSVKTLTIDGSAMLDVAGHTLRVVDSLVTLGEGTLRMQSANDSVLVERDARFAGGTTAGQLTDGLLLVERHFTQSSANSATSFAPSGSHRTLLGDSTITNVIAIEIPTSRVQFDSPDFSAFNAVEIYGGWVRFETSARALDATSARAGTRLSGTQFFADNGFESAGITFLDNLSVAGPLQVSQSFTADTVEFRGPAGGDTEQEIPNDDGETNIPYATILVSGPNVVMRDVSRGAYFLDRLHVSAGSLMLGGGVGILADEGTMAVTGSATLSFEEGQTTTLTFDSVYIATSVPVEPIVGGMSFRSFVQAGFSNFRAGGSYTASPRSSGVINFQDSETSYFRNLSFSPGSQTTMLSDVQVTGRLSRVPSEETVTLESDVLDINPRTIFVAGGLGFIATEGGQTYFRNVALSLSGNYTSPSEIEFNDVAFERMDPNPAEAYIFSQHTGGVTATWSDITFNSQLESGLYFRWDATPDFSSINFVNVTPALDCLASTCQQGDFAPLGDQQTATWTGASDDNWANTANWLEGAVPTAASDVIIASSETNLPTAPAGAQFRSLTVEADQMLYIDNSATVTVYGDVDIRGALLRRDQYSELLLRPADTASFSAEGGYIDVGISIDRGIGSVDGTVRLASNVTLDSANVDNDLRVYGGTLDINGHALMIGGDFNTLNYGRLKMTGSSVMTVMWDAMFRGESTDGLLTGGELRLYRGLSQYKGESDATFRSTGEHTVNFVGFHSNNIYFETSDATTGSRIGVLRISKVDGAVSINSGDVYVENIAGPFTNADLLIANVAASHLYVMGTIDSTVSSSNRGFSLGEQGFVTVLKGLGDGCTASTVLVSGAGINNFTPIECRIPQ